MLTSPERLGVYGGMFSPIHNGHIAAAMAFCEQIKLDKLIIIPTLLPPHKSIGASCLPVHRINMCNLAFEGNINVEVSDLEIKRGGISYTIDTLESLLFPNRRIFLLCGTDMMLSFNRWYRFQDIFKLCCPVYVKRETNALIDDKVKSKNIEYLQKYNASFREIVVSPLEVSSTQIRNLIREGKDISTLVPEKVRKYIYDNHLYEL